MPSQRPEPRSLEGIRLTPPDPPPKRQYLDADGNVFTRALRGLAPLSVVWWAIGLPLRIAVTLLNGEWTFEALYGGSTTVQRCVTRASVIATAVWSFMAWRCARNVEEKIWTWVARALVVILWLRFAYDLFAWTSPSSEVAPGQQF